MINVFKDDAVAAVDVFAAVSFESLACETGHKFYYQLKFDNEMTLHSKLMDFKAFDAFIIDINLQSFVKFKSKSICKTLISGRSRSGSGLRAFYSYKYLLIYLKIYRVVISMSAVLFICD